MRSTIKAMEVLKRDERGRVRVPKERREALLDEFERSGLSGARFAAHYGLKYSSFAGWVQRRKRMAVRAPVQEAGSSVRWLEAVAVAEGEPAEGVLMLHLPGGVRMEITRRTPLPLAAELLRLLSASGNAAEAVPC